MTARSTRIRQRGTVLIPAALRREHGLEPGTVVVAESWPTGILIRAAPQAAAEAVRSEWIDAVNREFAELRKDGEDWSGYQDELCAWDCTLADGLPVESA